MNTTHRGETSVCQVMCPLHFVFLNLLAQMSVWALLSVFANCMVNLLPLIGCKCSLVVTLWQTSVTRDAVMSHILLCCVVNPPMLQTAVNVVAQLHF